MYYLYVYLFLSWLTLIPVLTASYLIIDSPKRSEKPWLWVILCSFFGLLPMGIYLIKTRRLSWGILWIILWAIEIFGSAYYITVQNYMATH